MFDFCPITEPDHTEGAVILNMATIDPITALRIYADPRNWDHGAIYKGPGDGPAIAKAALENAT